MRLVEQAAGSPSSEFLVLVARDAYVDSKASTQTRGPNASLRDTSPAPSVRERKGYYREGDPLTNVPTVRPAGQQGCNRG